MKRSSIQSPPYSPGGSEMLWTTSSETLAPSGRSSKCGDSRLINAEAIEPVAQRPEGDTQQLGRGRLVEARGLQRLRDGLALDLVEEVVQRQAARAERAIERRHLVLRGRLREVEVALGDLVGGAQRHRPLEDVLQLAHVAGEVVAAQRQHRVLGNLRRRVAGRAREAL